MNSLLSLLSPTQFYILLALSLKPRHGYELMQQIATDSLEMVHIGPGALYGALQQLARDNLIEEVPSEAATDRRRQYRLTKKGWDRLNIDVAYYRHVSILARQRHV
jgi:DNA-binding PadR family transcriptional regulator